jgi:hypothetical protein
MKTVHDVAQIPTFSSPEQEREWWARHELGNDCLQHLLRPYPVKANWLGFLVLAFSAFVVLSFFTLAADLVGWL